MITQPTWHQPSAEPPPPPQLAALLNRLSDSESKYRTLLNALDEGFCVVEVLFDAQEKPVDYRFLETNRAFEDQTGLSDAVGQRMRELAPGLEEHWYETYGRIALTGQPARFQNQAAQLHRWYDVYAFRWGQPEARQVAILFTDITERKQAAEAQARLAAIVEGSEDGILSKSLEGLIQTWNAGAERMFGYRPEEIIGRPVTLLVPPELHEEELRVLERLKRGEQIEHYATVRVTKGGRKLHVSLTISPVKDREGQITGASTIVRDIGKVVRNRAELERLVGERTARLREAMGELEHMSYSMVHDMRAPLRAMKSFAGLLEEECASVLPDNGLEYVRRIRQSAARLDALVTGALNYSEVVRQPLAQVPVELAGLLRGMVASYPRLQAQAADVQIQFKQLFVLGQVSLLTQCFGNLLDNAAKFVAPGVKPRIRVWAEENVECGVRNAQRAGAPNAECVVPTRGSRAATESNGQRPPGSNPSASAHFVRIWVEDNGIGIPEVARDRIFRLFQRLHREEEYDGIGTGLAIVHKAVERMGGCLGLVCDPGAGCRFWVDLPRADPV